MVYPLKGTKGTTEIAIELVGLCLFSYVRISLLEKPRGIAQEVVLSLLLVSE